MVTWPQTSALRIFFRLWVGMTPNPVCHRFHYVPCSQDEDCKDGTHTLWTHNGDPGCGCGLPALMLTRPLSTISRCRSLDARTSTWIACMRPVQEPRILQDKPQ